MRPWKLGSCSLVVAFVLILSLGALAQTPGFAQKLYGTWYTYPFGNPLTDSLRHQFRHNSATGTDEIVVIRSCAGDRGAVIARAVSPIEISQDSIRILKSSSEVRPAQGNSECRAKVDVGVIGYSFSDDGEHLILTDAGGNPDLLELAREDPEAATAVPQDLFGTWLLAPVNTKTNQVQERYVFYATADHHERVRRIAICLHGNNSIVAHVDSDMSVTKDQITFLQSASHDQREGNFICTASVTAGTWHYSIAPGGVAITLSSAGGQTMKLTREQPAGLNY